MSPGRIGIVASRVRAEEKAIMAELGRRGAPHEHVDSRNVWRDADAPPEWDVVLNREIAGVRACYTARTLEALGSTVLNSAEATETCTDKWRTTLALCSAGLPVPRTLIAMTPDAALEALEELGYPAVLKPLTGSWGRMVSLLPDRHTARTVLEHVGAHPSPQARLVYLQQYVRKPDRDIRVLVVGGEAVGASYRIAHEWRTNVALGARSERCPLFPELEKLAVSAARAVHADIAGVDVIEDESGRMYVLEVNDRIEFTGLQAALGPQGGVVESIVDLLLRGGRP